MTIPISQVVQVLPGVIAAGGTPSRLSGLVITQDPSIVPGAVPKQFFTATDVSAWFGPNAPETTIANNYFPGTVNAGQLPYVLKFAGASVTPTPAGSYGGTLTGMTLAALQALSGALIFTVNGAQFTSGTISLAGATSFSDAATLLSAGVAVVAAAPTNGALISVPASGTTAQNYFVRCTWSTPTGESLASAETSLSVTAGNTVQVAAPASPPPTATGWNVYMALSTGAAVRQNATPIALGASFTPAFPPGMAGGVTNVNGVASGAPAFSLTFTSGGALPARTYYVRVTWTTSMGETLAGPEQTLTFSAGQLMIVVPTAPPPPATGYCVYVSTASGLETKRITVAGTSQWTEPTTGLPAPGVIVPPPVPASPPPASAPVTIAYDTQRNRFTLLSNAVGSSQTISDISGTLATPLRLSAAAGATIVTTGTDGDTPASVMTRVVGLDTDWGVFTTAYAASLSDRLAYAAWNSGQAYQYVYLGWDTDAGDLTPNNAATFGAQAFAAPYQGTWPVYGSQALAGALMGYVAGVNFNVPNGRTTAAFRQFNSAPAATATTLAVANALLSNKYTYLGAYANQANAYTVSYAGNLSGAFLWVDTYIDQIYLNRELQRSLWEGMLAYNSIPYNQDGYSALYNNALPTIYQAVSAGIIRSGVTLSASQAQQVNAQAGRVVSDVLQTRGWYLLIGDPTNPAQARQQRTTPVAYLWYTDGGSVQALTIRSIAVI